LPARQESINLWFVFVAPTVCVSHAFVYDAVDVNNIVVISSNKPPSHPYMQVTTKFGRFAEHIKPN